jgi:transposase
MESKLIVGIDIAKAEYAVAICWEGKVETLGTFPNRSEGHQCLTEQVEALRKSQGVEQVHLILEATGGYEAALVAAAYEQAWWVSLPNPKQVRDWARGVGYRAKTDRVDARILAHYGADMAQSATHRPARPWRQKSPSLTACSSGAKTSNRQCTRNEHAWRSCAVVPVFRPR